MAGSWLNVLNTHNYLILVDLFVVSEVIITKVEEN